MLTLTYSAASEPTARTLAEAGGFRLNRGPTGDINWGRAVADTRLNPDISNVTNKRIMRELFAEHDVPMPTLYGRGEAHRLALMGHRLVGRPDRHTKGRGFWVINDERSWLKAIRGTERKAAATHFMEYIDKERAPREYRVHIFQGLSIRISEKAFGTTGATAHGNYTTARPQHRVFHVRKAAKAAVDAVGLDFGAVDILANDTECWVTEVNAAPGLGGSMPRLYAEVFQRWSET